MVKKQQNHGFSAEYKIYKCVEDNNLCHVLICNTVCLCWGILHVLF